MSEFVPTTRDLRGILMFCFRLQKKASEAHRMLVEAFGDNVLSERQCQEWFGRFKRGDFDVENKERGKPPKKAPKVRKEADAVSLVGPRRNHLPRTPQSR